MVFQVTLACLSDLLGLARNLEVQAREARGGLEKALELPGRGHPSADLLREDPRDRGEEVRLLCREEGALVLVGHRSVMRMERATCVVAETSATQNRLSG